MGNWEMGNWEWGIGNGELGNVSIYIKNKSDGCITIAFIFFVFFL